MAPRSTLYTNGRIVTCDPAQPAADGGGGARRTDRGRRRRGGGAAAARARCDGIDLGGRTMVPGFIDAHNHMACTAETFFAVDASPRRSAPSPSWSAAVAARRERTPPGAWIRGFGMDWTRFAEGRRPTRWDLDEATGEHPVVILHVSGHYALVNSRALADRGMTDDAVRPGGRLARARRRRPARPASCSTARPTWSCRPRSTSAGTARTSIPPSRPMSWRAWSAKPRGATWRPA